MHYLDRERGGIDVNGIDTEPEKEDEGTETAREFADLWLVGALLVAATGALLAPGVPEPVEWVLGGPYLLVVPGYALVSALFPCGPSTESELGGRTAGGPSWTARFGLALVLSVLTVGVVGVILGWTVGLTLLTAVVTLDAVTITALAIARHRRLTVDPEQRAAPVTRFRPHLRLGQTTGQSLAMLLALFVLGSSLAFAAASAPPSDGHTEVTLLTERPDGTYVADNFSTELAAGESQPLHVSIENAENEQVEYGVVVLSQNVDPDGAILAQERLDEFSVTLADGDRRVIERSVTPTQPGESTRLRVLVYEGDVPASPSVDTADYELHLWVDITGSESG